MGITCFFHSQHPCPLLPILLPPSFITFCLDYLPSPVFRKWYDITPRMWYYEVEHPCLLCHCFSFPFFPLRTAHSIEESVCRFSSLACNNFFFFWSFLSGNPTSSSLGLFVCFHINKTFHLNADEGSIRKEFLFLFRERLAEFWAINNRSWPAVLFKTKTQVCYASNVNKFQTDGFRKLLQPYRIQNLINQALFV